MKIAVFYGSNMGATEEVAKKIALELKADIFNVETASNEDMESYDALIIGSSTWGYGDLQDDWNNFFDDYGIPNVKGKTVAIFGLGDQEDHHDVFVNAIGILHQIFESAGAKIIGYWPTEGYSFGSNTSAVKDSMFLGLPLDEVNQAKFTDERIKKWLELIKLFL